MLFITFTRYAINNYFFYIYYNNSLYYSYDDHVHFITLKIISNGFTSWYCVFLFTCAVTRGVRARRTTKKLCFLYYKQCYNIGANICIANIVSNTLHTMFINYILRISHIIKALGISTHNNNHKLLMLLFTAELNIIISICTLSLPILYSYM